MILILSTALGAILATASVPAGPYEVRRDGFTLPGFKCDENSTADGGVAITYPVSMNLTYPIVSLLHGSGSGKFVDLSNSIASLGIVVVAPWACGQLDDQQLWAVAGSEKHQDLHPVLSRVDFTKVGLIGHSMGAAWTFSSGVRAHDYDVKAIVASHGASTNAAAKLPSDLAVMCATGSGDPKRRFLWYAYLDTPARPRIYAELSGGRHMEPEGPGRLNEFDAHFLGCYLLPDKTARARSCDKIYGNGTDTLCKKNPMSGCKIEKDYVRSDI